MPTLNVGGRTGSQAMPEGEDTQTGSNRDRLAQELMALRQLPADILTIRELDQLLLSIVNTSRDLLESEMAGVLLIDEDELVMRCCTGNKSAQTMHLRMTKGQGVAGRVLELGSPCKVDSYLDSDAISHEFDPLARTEMTICAVAAPLVVHGETIGVLEVWRRRPLAFTEDQCDQLAGLASLAAIAIDNARLYDRQQETVRRLSEAQTSIARQLAAVRQARALQQTLKLLLLDGEGLAAIVRAVAEQMSGGVAALTGDLDVLACYPRTLDVAGIRSRLRDMRLGTNQRTDAAKVVKLGDSWLSVQPIRAGPNHLGWFCITTAQAPRTTDELVAGEAVVASALSLVMQRSADEARWSEREEILWDLLEGHTAGRLAAVDRAKWLKVELLNCQRVIRAQLWNAEDLASVEGWDSSTFEAARRDILRRLRRVLRDAHVGELLAIRGEELAVLAHAATPVATRKLVDTFEAEILKAVPGVELKWGVSGPYEKPIELGRANDEAKKALNAAGRMGTPIALYDELGIIRFLMSGTEKGDLGEFVHGVVGPLVEADNKRNGALLETLRAYLSEDCSQQMAAAAIHVHHKTLRYRLNRIEELTDLDLKTHEGRMHADLALKIFDVMGIDSD